MKELQLNLIMGEILKISLLTFSHISLVKHHRKPQISDGDEMGNVEIFFGSHLEYLLQHFNIII